MNFYTMASKFRKEMKRQLRSIEHNELIDKQQFSDTLRKTMYHEFKETAELGIDLMLMFRELAEAKGLYSERITGTWFITIRPDETKCTFEDFYKYIYNLIKRKCFLNYTLSFEQKGEDEHNLGKGFHVHIIAKLKQRSKEEIIRDLYSSLHLICEKQCIQVSRINNNKDLDKITSYMTNYTSKDEHKIVTKECDDLWRKIIGLKNTYVNNLPATIKSEVAGYIDSTPI